MKKTIASLLSTLLCAALLLTGLPMNVSAADSASAQSAASITGNGVTATLITDKDAYKATETASVTLDVANSNSYDVTIVRGELVLIDGMRVTGGQGPQNAELPAGEMLSFPYDVAFAKPGYFAGLGDVFSSGWLLGKSAGMGGSMKVACELLGGICKLKVGFFGWFQGAARLLRNACIVAVTGLFASMTRIFVRNDKTLVVTKTILVDGVPRVIAAVVTYGKAGES